MEDDSAIGGFLIFAFIVILIIIACKVGVTDDGDVAKFAQTEGWQNAKPTGYKYFACSKDDWFHTGFTAEKNGKPISGVICRGLFFKGATLRLD